MRKPLACIEHLLYAMLTQEVVPIPRTLAKRRKNPNKNYEIPCQNPKSLLKLGTRTITIMKILLVRLPPPITQRTQLKEASGKPATEPWVRNIYINMFLLQNIL